MIVLVLGSGGYYGYETGLILAQREITRMNGRLSDLVHTIDELEGYNSLLVRAADEAKLAETRWRERYEALVANREYDRLFDVAEESESNGIDAARLAFAAGTMRVGRTCDGDHESKSFKVNTPVNENDNDTAGFADNRIIVSANGISAVSQGGHALVWYDPKQPVAVRFRTLNGNSSVASGILPLRHAVAVDGAEYRFRVAPGGRGIIKIIGDRCWLAP